MKLWKLLTVLVLVAAGVGGTIPVLVAAGVGGTILFAGWYVPLECGVMNRSGCPFSLPG